MATGGRQTEPKYNADADPNHYSDESAAANSDGESKEYKSNNASTGGESTVLASIPALPEFVPGKTWQGITKNVDEDSHITSGSFFRSLRVNTVTDDFLTSLTKSSPLSTAGEIVRNLDICGIPKGNSNPIPRPSPGLPQPMPVRGKWSGVNRPSSWAAGQYETIGHPTYVPKRQPIRQLQNINYKEKDHWELIGEQLYYDPKKLIGTGSMSAVFEGRYGAGKIKKIAVKKILCADNKEATNIYREIAMITNLIEPSRDPNIVDFIHSYNDVNELYIAFELGKGTLVDYVKESNASWRVNLTCLNVNRGISEGLNYIHSKDVVHRDMKPQNIIIVERNAGVLKAVIGDFGSAKATNGSLYSLTGRTGSLGFIAPEVYTAMSQDQSVILGSLCNRKSDIFSTGLLLYYTIALGNNAFGHVMAAQMAIQTQTPPTFDKIDQIRNSFAHQSLIECMLYFKPEERPNAKTVLLHPANWSEIKILNYLTKKSDEFEDMIKTDPSNDSILEDHILIPNGNWMNNLPPCTQTYLKAFKVNKGSPPLYKGKESSIRSLLRVIRNTNSHYQGYPQNVQIELGEYPGGHVDLWLQVCPKLLMHVVEKLGAP